MEVVVALLFGTFLGGAIMSIPMYVIGEMTGRADMHKKLTGKELEEKNDDKRCEAWNRSTY